MARISVALDAPEPDRGELAVWWARADDPQTQRVRVQLTAQRWRDDRKWWALCPTCKRRCARLAFAADLRSLGCRVCLGLHYGPARATRAQTAAAMAILAKRYGLAI